MAPKRTAPSKDPCRLPASGLAMGLAMGLALALALASGGCSYSLVAGDQLRREPFDVRLVTEVDPLAPGKLPPRLDLWLRVRGELAPEPWLHQCLAAYASDLSLIDTICLPHDIGVLSPGYQFASLDHAMWFHRPFRADERLFYTQESPAAAGARGFASGRLFTREGQLVVSVVQEGLVRPVTPR